MSKKFEIQNEKASGNDAAKKKFEIQPDNQMVAGAVPSSINERGRFAVTWHKQENASDCGPMVILNTLIRNGFVNGPKGVQEIRDAVAMRRLRDGQTTAARVGGEVSATGWLTSSDIHKYLRELGMTAEILSNKPDIERVKEELLGHPNRFYILATRSHFKAIRYTGSDDSFELLDSQQGGPQRLSKQEAYDLLDLSVGLAGVLVM